MVGGGDLWFVVWCDWFGVLMRVFLRSRWFVTGMYYWILRFCLHSWFSQYVTSWTLCPGRKRWNFSDGVSS